MVQTSGNDIEECDDANSDNNDSCVLNCKNATCQDGYVWSKDGGEEECDDKNSINTDDCLNTCVNAICGDSIIRTSSDNSSLIEACDDGNNVTTDACIDCVVAICHDGYVWAGKEDCDDGNTFDNDSCVEDCNDADCGDDHVWVG